MTRFKSFRLAAVLAVMATLAVACGSNDSPAVTDTGNGSSTTLAEKGKIVVGSTNVPEQLIVAQLYAKVLEHAGYQVTVRPNLGSREIVEPALEKGEIDVLAEYAGTALEFLNKGAGEATSDAGATATKLRDRFASLGVSVLVPAPAADSNALVVTKATAAAKKLAKTSDLAAIAKTLTLGGPPECPKRPFCMLGFEKTYGLKFKAFKPLDVGGPVTVAALEKGDIDVALLFSSDGVIAAKDFVVLDDDKHLQPADNLVPVVRTKVLDPDITRLLNDVSAKLTTAELSKLNKQVGVDKQDPAAAASAWLKDQQLI